MDLLNDSIGLFSKDLPFMSTLQHDDWDQHIPYALFCLSVSSTCFHRLLPLLPSLSTVNLSFPVMYPFEAFNEKADWNRVNCSKTLTKTSNKLSTTSFNLKEPTEKFNYDKPSRRAHNYLFLVSWYMAFQLCGQELLNQRSLFSIGLDLIESKKIYDNNTIEIEPVEGPVTISKGVHCSTNKTMLQQRRLIRSNSEEI